MGLMSDNRVPFLEVWVPEGKEDFHKNGELSLDNRDEAAWLIMALCDLIATESEFAGFAPKNINKAQYQQTCENFYRFFRAVLDSTTSENN